MQDGSKFKVLFTYAPYFYVAVEPGLEREVESVLRRKYADQIADVVLKELWDLDMPNHLAGNKRTEIQLKFRNVQVSPLLSICFCLYVFLCVSLRDVGSTRKCMKSSHDR
jgi:hypothetical protein